MPWSIGGTGGAYLLAEPGELEIELFKRDLKLRGARGTDLRAILAGPDREVIEEVVIPSTGGGDSPGPLQREVLTAEVNRPGVYALNLTVKGDRHGTNIEWAFNTNATAWVVETSRGHRDERHREPIVLTDAQGPANINFLPRAGEFEIEVEALPVDAEPLMLYDETGAEVAEIPIIAEESWAIREYMRLGDYMRLGPPDEGEASARFTVPADETRGHRPWRLHLPQGQAFVEIDGLTRWGGEDLYRNHCVWTPEADSWFPWLQHRYLISPYQRTIYGQPGERSEVTFRVHNNAPEERTVQLALEFSGDPWEAQLSDQTVTLDGKQAEDITVTFQAPADEEEHVCHVRATPEEAPEFTTYATLTARGGDSAVGDELELPFVLKPYAHENRQFGYLPDYAVNNQVYFDLQNRGFVVAGGTLYRELDDGTWGQTNLSEAVVRCVPERDTDGWSARGTKVAFDADNDVYLVAQSGSTAALLRSTDGGETFTAYVIEGRENEPRGWDIEQFSGHNTPEGPPPVVRITRTHRDSDRRLRWRSTNDLDLFVAEKTADGDIAFNEPVRLTDKALGSSFHSGIPSMIVSRGSKVHVVWGEATDPDVSREEIPGVPAYVATYDRQAQSLGEPVFMSYGPPPNDGHNTPSITMDSEGHLHVVVGTHGRPFQYLRSLAPNDAYSGWTEAIRTSEDDLRQTYVGLVCGADDALHLVFRLWMSGEEHLDGGLWAALAYQRKPAGGEWEEPKILLAPPLSEYSIYYHRLTVDRAGDLFISYDYWSTMWFYRNDQRGPVAAGSGRPGRGWGRAVLTSPDGGDRWMLW
ncbi:MAG: BNR-4 repeat-containing protein [Armatimonadota bacterium]